MNNILVEAFKRSVMAFKADDTSKDLFDEDQPAQLSDQAIIQMQQVEGSANEDLLRKEPSQVMVGDPCKAVFSADGLLYDCIIVDIDRDAGKCVVQYDWYQNEEEQDLADLYFTNNTENEASNDADPIGGKTKDEPCQWSEGDTCFAPEDEAGHYALGRIESFPAAGLAEVVFHNSNTQKVVDSTYLRQIESKRASNAQQRPGNTQKGKKKKNKDKNHNGHNSASFNPPVCPWDLHLMSESLPKQGTHSKQGNKGAAIPVPPPPMIPDDVHSSEEALSNMLMSWYLTGYNTGYYQGMLHGS